MKAFASATLDGTDSFSVIIRVRFFGFNPDWKNSDPRCKFPPEVQPELF